MADGTTAFPRHSVIQYGNKSELTFSPILTKIYPRQAGRPRRRLSDPIHAQNNFTLPLSLCPTIRNVKARSVGRSTNFSNCRNNNRVNRRRKEAAAVAWQVRQVCRPFSFLVSSPPSLPSFHQSLIISSATDATHIMHVCEVGMTPFRSAHKRMMNLKPERGNGINQIRKLGSKGIQNSNLLVTQMQPSSSHLTNWIQNHRVFTHIAVI